MGWDPWEETKDWAEEGGVLGDEAKDLWDNISGETAADAISEAAALQSDSANYAADIQQQMYEQTRQDQMPWMEAGEQALGTLQEMMANAPTMEDYEMSDYASFMRDEGLKGIEAKSLAGGYYNTGATSREMLDYSRNVAGQDYQQYLNNYYQSLNPYLAMSGSGQQMANTMGTQGMNSANTQGNIAMNSANAQANATIGAANAQAQGMQNLMGLGMMGVGAYMGRPAAAATGVATPVAGGAYTGQGASMGTSYQTPAQWNYA